MPGQCLVGLAFDLGESEMCDGVALGWDAEVGRQLTGNRG